MRIGAAAILSMILMAACHPAEKPETPPQQGAVSEIRALSEAALLASVCSGCHMSGSDHAGLVSLDGKTAEDIRLSLIAYRDDETRQTVMNRIARGYSPDEIAKIATFIAEETD